MWSLNRTNLESEPYKSLSMGNIRGSQGDHKIAAEYGDQREFCYEELSKLQRCKRSIEVDLWPVHRSGKCRADLGFDL